MSQIILQLGLQYVFRILVSWKARRVLSLHKSA